MLVQRELTEDNCLPLNFYLDFSPGHKLI